MKWISLWKGQSQLCFALFLEMETSLYREFELPMMNILNMTLGKKIMILENFTEMR